MERDAKIKPIQPEGDLPSGFFAFDSGKEDRDKGRPRGPNLDYGKKEKA